MQLTQGTAMEKLSVQERLSLAAKTKSKKKYKKQSPCKDNLDSPTASPIPPSISEIYSPENTPDVSISKEAAPTESGSGENDESEALSFFYKLLGNDYDFTDVNPSDLLKDLFPIVFKLHQDVENLNGSITKLKSNTSTSDSSLIKLLKQKDLKIDELLKEGETLSKKELHLSDKIKSLNKTIRDLTSDLNIHKDDLQECHTQVDVLQKTNQSLEHSLLEAEKSLKTTHFREDEKEEKYKELLSDYESLKNQNSTLEVRNNELLKKIEELEQVKEFLQHQFDIKYKALQETSQEEMTRLESKLEQLRISIETGPENDYGDNRTGEFREDYEKVLSQYHATQNELKETNENWKSIEYALNEKIFMLESSLDELHKKNDEISGELHAVRDFRDKLLSASEATNNIRSQLEQELLESKNALSHTNEQLDSLREDYDLAEKQNEILRKQLAGALNTQDKIPHRGSEVDPKLQYSEISGNMMPPVEEPTDSLWNGPVSKLHDEISTHDANISAPEFCFEPDEDIPEEAADLELSKRRSSAFSLNLNSSYTRPNTGQASAINNTNVQMVSKLASEIRRLEMELSSVKEASGRLSREKDEANAEISRLLQISDDAQGVLDEKNSLESQVADLTKKQDALLQLLGEKSERVEELENDVDDLKDMMRSQFQQIVQLQEQVR